MKKWILIGIAIATVAVLSVAGVVYAQAQTGTGTGTCPWGDADGDGVCPMSGTGGRGGMRGSGVLAEYMHAAMAEQLGISETDLEASLEAGETMWSIAEAQGVTTEDFQQMMVDARSAALDAAVADGALTQEQADAMLSRTTGNGAGCGMMGGGGRGGMMRGFWQNQP